MVSESIVAAMRIAARFIVAAMLAGLAACAGPSKRPDIPEAGEGPDRHVSVPPPTHWRLSGRLAVSNGKDGGSGRLEWRQDDRHFDVRLRAPVTGQNWQLLGDDTGCQLQGLHPEPVLARSPEELLRRELHWELPVGALGHWLFGQGGDGARTTRDAKGHPFRITDAGWTIEYRDWRPQGDRWLPHRLVARKPPFQVRLAVSEWQLDPTPQ